MSGKGSNSPHILNTSANLLGLCFILLTSIKVLKVEATTIIDSITSITILIFMTSCMLSFLSMRGVKGKSEKYETIADYFFLSGLILLFCTTILISFDIIR